MSSFLTHLRAGGLVPARARTALAVGLLAATLASSAPRPAGAMPPPAPGNTRGLPVSVREAIRRDPSLFYPRKGFKDVIARQKAQREATRRRLMLQGMRPDKAEAEAAQSTAVTRFCPVLAGIYSDKGSPDWPVNDLVDQLFNLNYSQGNSYNDPGSMREHYRDMSYGTFDLQGGVFGWFPLPQPMAFYASDDNGLGTDRTSGETGAFIRHTLQSADATVDFRPYDNDGPDGVPNSGDDDGVVDLVMFVHPNEGGECGGDDIWSHSFHYSGWPEHSGQMFVTNDLGANGQPLEVDDYVIMPALSCFGGRRIEIGVFSHEFGHALGLPDLYDRTPPDAQTGQGPPAAGMGLYCLMAAGSYGGDYSHPAYPVQMCAWSKEFLGWLSPKEIVCDETTALYYQGDAPEAMKMWRGGDYTQREWFLVENRQKKKWDRYLPGSGFLITHIDDKVFTQNDEPCVNGNPCPAHYQVMTVEADNQWEMQQPAPANGAWFGEAADFFSATTNDSFGDLTLPSSRDHTGALTGVVVDQIGPSADKMFAHFGVSQTCAAVPSLAMTQARVRGGCDFDSFLDAGEEVDVAVSIHNQPTAAPATGIVGTLTSLDPSFVIVPGASARFPDLGRGGSGETIVPFRVRATSIAACSTVAHLRLDLSAAGGYAVSQNFTLRVGLDSLYIPYANFSDDVESSDNGWRHYADLYLDDWSRNTNGNHTVGAIPGRSWYTSAPPTGKDASLEAPAFVPSASTVFSYWHRYDTEDGWDGYVLELSTNGGSTWIDVGDLTNVGYDDAVMVNPQSTISGRRCWNGLSPNYPLFEQVTLPMATWAGQTCLIRFRLATDLASTGVTPIAGLNIDDLSVTNASVLRERCEVTPVCGGVESDPPTFAGLEEALNPGVPTCDAVDLKWHAATDASGPVSYLIYASETTPVPLTNPVASTTRLRHRLVGLASGRTWNFVVRARDAHGNVDGNTVEQSLTLACDPPNVVVRSVALQETAGCDDDGRADAGEHLSFMVTLQNVGLTTARTVRAQLRTTSPWLAVREGFASYVDLGAAHYETSAQPFLIQVASNAPCLTTAPLTLEITAAGGYHVTRAIELPLESDESFEFTNYATDVEAGDDGFTHFADAGGDDWARVTTDAYSGTHSWFSADEGAVKNASLVSPALYVTGQSVLTFRHRFVLEEGFDGAVLEISTDDGSTWTNLGASYNSQQEPIGVAFGAAFTAGQAFWSGTSNGWQLETIHVGTLNDPLGQPLYAGKTVRFRWRIGCDDSNTEPPYEGWWIDDVALSNTGSFTTHCDATPACNVVAVEAGSGPRRTGIEMARPNPVHDEALVRFAVAAEDAGPVAVRVFDVGGRVVRTLFEGPREAGTFEVRWNRTNERGARVAGGVYFLGLQAGGRQSTKRLVVVQ